MQMFIVSQLPEKPKTNRLYKAVIATILVLSLLAASFIGYNIGSLATTNHMTTLANQVSAQVTTSSVAASEIASSVATPETASNSTQQVVAIDPSLSQLYQTVRDSVVMIAGSISQSTRFFQQVYQVQGSGFVCNFTGTMVIVTNFHVVDGAQNISVTFRDGNAYSALVLGSDAYSDLAVLSVSAPQSELAPLQLVSSSTLQVGDSVIAIGSPFGLTGSMTTGIVSQLGRTVTESTTGGFAIADVIQISTPINPGNSGGPLLNDNGQVVGITFASVSGSQGVEFAIPSNAILREITGLVQSGSYTQHSWLGIAGVDNSYDIATQLGLKVTYGMLITQVTSGGPAEKAGLKGGSQQVIVDGNTLTSGGDIIVSINGTRIVNSDDLSTYLEENTQPNQTITLTIMRAGAAMDISVTLGTRPAPTTS